MLFWGLQREELQSWARHGDPNAWLCQVSAVWLQMLTVWICKLPLPHLDKESYPTYPEGSGRGWHAYSKGQACTRHSVNTGHPVLPQGASHTCYAGRPLIFFFFFLIFGCARSSLLCMGLFSLCGEKWQLFIMVHGLLTAEASPVVEHRLQGAQPSVPVAHRLSSCGSWALGRRVSCCGTRA